MIISLLKGQPRVIASMRYQLLIGRKIEIARLILAFIINDIPYFKIILIVKVCHYNQYCYFYNLTNIRNARYAYSSILDKEGVWEKEFSVV